MAFGSRENDFDVIGVKKMYQTNPLGKLKMMIEHVKPVVPPVVPPGVSILILTVIIFLDSWRISTRKQGKQIEGYRPEGRMNMAFGCFWLKKRTHDIHSPSLHKHLWQDCRMKCFLFSTGTCFWSRLAFFLSPRGDDFEKAGPQSCAQIPKVSCRGAIFDWNVSRGRQQKDFKGASIKEELVSGVCLLSTFPLRTRWKCHNSAGNKGQFASSCCP